MHFESSLSPCRLMTSVLCTLAFKKKRRQEQKPRAKKTEVRGRLEKLQTPPADPYSVFLFLLSKTELVKNFSCRG